MRLAPLTIFLLGCGGGVVTNDAGDAGDAADQNRPDSGFTSCTSPAGYQLCNGACGSSCPPDKTGNPGCASDEPGMPHPQDLGICRTTMPLPPFTQFCDRCKDGNVCALDSARWWTPDPSNTFAVMGCTVPDYAKMYALNGRLDMARYTDRSAYTDQPLPTPSSCPMIAGATLCGGTCGGCPNGFICVGRSPLHPYGLCVNEMSDVCERDVLPSCMDLVADRRCLTFKVDAPSQVVADKASFCVDRAICDAAAGISRWRLLYGWEVAFRRRTTS